MHTRTQQQRNEIASALPAAHPDNDPEKVPFAPVLFTVEQFADRQPAFTAPALRNLIFKAEPRNCSKGEIPGNGLIEFGAVIRLGRKVMIHESRFYAWVEAQGANNDRHK